MAPAGKTSRVMSILQLCSNPLAYPRLTADLEETDELLALVYQMQSEFTEKLLAHLRSPSRITLLASHGQTFNLHQLTASMPHISAHTWARNRMMHSKLICLPKIHVVWIGSHNWTEYAWTSGTNHSIRIQSERFCADVKADIETLIARAHSIDR